MSKYPQNALDLYMNYVLNSTLSPLLTNIENLIPRSIDHSISLAKQKTKQIKNTNEWQNRKEKWASLFLRTAKNQCIYTPKVQENLDNFLNNNEFIEVAHQPKFLGGERFILNKLACGGEISKYFPGSVPIFYIADYDKVHNELIKTRIPVLNSTTGISIGIDTDIESCYEGQCIECLPLPSQDYLNNVINQIRENYQFSINSCNYSHDKTELLLERVEQVLLLIKRSYMGAQDYSDWFLKILSEIANVIYDYGYLFIQASQKEYKELLLPYYEQFISNSSHYITLYNQIYDKFNAYGINPPLRQLSRDFIPFFYECPCNTCNKRRIQLYRKSRNNVMVLYGECEKCHEKIEIEFHPNSIDLSDHIYALTPRVDTRQYLISKALQPAIHVSGTGETKYYMQTLPILQQFDSNLMLPVIYFYNKTTLNTFLTRHLEKQLIAEEYPQFLDYIKKIMKPLGKFNKILAKEQPNKELSQVSQMVAQILKNQHDQATLFKKYLEKQLKLDQPNQNITAAYLSNFFGKISKHRSGQEAVYHWITSGIHNGIHKLLADYQKIYKPWMKPGLQVIL